MHTLTHTELYCNLFISVYFQPGQKIDDYWDPGKALLTEPGKFLESLFKFDKDNIPESNIRLIQPYIDDEAFQPAAIAKVQFSCFNLKNAIWAASRK